MYDKYKNFGEYLEAKTTLSEKLHGAFERIRNDGFSSLPPPKRRISADYHWQMERLKENGVQIGDEQACRRALRDITYYRLKGYVLLFDGAKVDFETLLNICEFDSQMRKILLYALSEIEIHLRAQFSYFHSRRYGAYGYLDGANYSSEHNHSDFLNQLEKNINENADFSFVWHYLEEHNGVLPFWVMSELMGFGQWVRFYKDMNRTVYFYQGEKRTDQQEFLKQLYGLVLVKEENCIRKEALREALSKYGTASGDNRFLKWLKCCRLLRNMCAHCKRLYGAKFPWNPKIPWVPNTPKTAECAAELNRQHLHHTLFGSIVAMMFLYPDDEAWNGNVFEKIKSLLEEYGPKGIGGNGIGFPPDWETWLQKP